MGIIHACNGVEENFLNVAGFDCSQVLTGTFVAAPDFLMGLIQGKIAQQVLQQIVLDPFTPQGIGLGGIFRPLRLGAVRLVLLLDSKIKILVEPGRAIPASLRPAAGSVEKFQRRDINCPPSGRRVVGFR